MAAASASACRAFNSFGPPHLSVPLARLNNHRLSKTVRCRCHPPRSSESSSSVNIGVILGGSALYQVYDGSLKLDGCKKMLWHKRPLEEEKMQMPAADEREFPFAPEGEECAPDEIVS